MLEQEKYPNFQDGGTPGSELGTFGVVGWQALVDNNVNG